MKIGFIGVGNIGGTLAAKFSAAGHEVRLANSRGPETLGDVAKATGGTSSNIRGAIEGADAVILSVPYKAIEQLPGDLFANAPDDFVIIDTGNYYPMRDGVIPGLDGDIADTEWVAKHFDRPIVKAFNSISANSLRSKGKPSGSVQRVALPVSGDDAHAKAVASELVASAGFEPFDAGSLAESWRQQPGTGTYTTDLDAAYLRIALERLDKSDRAALPQRRESNLKLILSLDAGPGSPESVRVLRAQWGLPADL